MAHTDDIKNLTQELSRRIEQSPVKLQYEAAKARIESDAVLRLRMKEFKAARMAFEWKALQGEPADFNEERSISKLYTDLLLVEDACAFLTAERALLDLVDTVYQTVADACGVELDF